MNKIFNMHQILVLYLIVQSIILISFHASLIWAQATSEPPTIAIANPASSPPVGVVAPTEPIDSIEPSKEHQSQSNGGFNSPSEVIKAPEAIESLTDKNAAANKIIGDEVKSNEPNNSSLLKTQTEADPPADDKSLQRSLSDLSNGSVINKNTIGAGQSEAPSQYGRNNNANDADADDDDDVYDDEYNPELDTNVRASEASVPVALVPPKIKADNSAAGQLKDASTNEQLSASQPTLASTPTKNIDDRDLDNDDDDDELHYNNNDYRPNEDGGDADDEMMLMSAEKQPLEDDNNGAYNDEEEDDMIVGNDNQSLFPGYDEYQEQERDQEDDGYNNDLAADEQYRTVYPYNEIEEDPIMTDDTVINEQRLPNGHMDKAADVRPNGNMRRQEEDLPLMVNDYDDDDDDDAAAAADQAKQQPGGHYENEWVDHSDPNDPKYHKEVQDENVWQDPNGTVHHRKSLHRSSSTINKNPDPNNFHEEHEEQHQESKSSVYNGDTLSNKRHNFHESHFQANNEHQTGGQYYNNDDDDGDLDSDNDSELESDSDSDSDTDSDFDFDFGDSNEPIDEMDMAQQQQQHHHKHRPHHQNNHHYNPAVDMAKRALDSLNGWPPRSPPLYNNHPLEAGGRPKKLHRHRHHNRHQPFGYNEPVEYESQEDPYGTPYDPLYNDDDPYASDFPAGGSSATAFSGSQMPGASATAQSSSFNGGSHHVVSDRSYIGPDGKWVRETFSNRDGDVTSNVYHEDDPTVPTNLFAINNDLQRRHRARINKLRAKQNKTMSKIAKRQEKMHKRMMRKHQQNMARAQAMASRRLLF